MSSHIFDFDDTHLETIHHPSGPVAPVCFALGEHLGLSGKEILLAFVLGAEAELRIANAVCPSHYDLGWHVTSSTGVFGAAVAASILLKLDRQQFTYALGIAGTQSLGMREVFGTMTKPFHPGRAAEVGLHAALLAQKGFTSSSRILEAPRGFANTTSPTSDLTKVTVGWGIDWELLKNAFKPYACGIVLHPAIDAGIELGNKLSHDPALVASIEVRVNKYVLELTGKPTPSVGLEGKFSIYHAVSIAFLTGAGGEDQFSDEAVADKQVQSLRGRVQPVVDANIPEHKAIIRLRTVDGTEHEVTIEHASGSIENPMTDDMLEAKFRAVATKQLGDQATSAALKLLWNLDKVDLVSDILDLSHAEELV
jgi:2-methylcitrate dehydratase PrpD